MLPCPANALRRCLLVAGTALCAILLVSTDAAAEDTTTPATRMMLPHIRKALYEQRPIHTRPTGRVLYADIRLDADITDGTYSVKGRGPGGQDGNAYKTVAQAVAAMQAGDTLYIRGGRYVERGIALSNMRQGTADRWYTISSYPAEWAVIDGGHKAAPLNEGGQLVQMKNSIFYGTTQANKNNYIRIEHLEITGAGLGLDHPKYPSNGCGIAMRGQHLEFRFLYVHDNYGITNNNCAGVQLGNASGCVLVEYCHFSDNGDINGTKTTSVSNLMIFADYAYKKRVDPEHATTRNAVRYNLLETSAKGDGRYTVTGFKHKAMQRLTGYAHCDRKSAEDLFPNDDAFQAYGDQIHHNIFLNLPIAIEIDQDYAQVHHNIILGNRHGPGAEDTNCIQGRDANSTRRGPFGFCVYNNTIITQGCRGIIHHPVPDHWQGDSPYTKCWIQNNIVQGAPEGYDWAAISVEADNVKDTGGWPVKEQRLDRNYFYKPASNHVAYIDTTKYTAESLVAAGAADKVFVGSTAGLFQGKTGSGRFKTQGGHRLDGETIGTAGVGGAHPYLAGVRLPTYIGATNPQHDTADAWDPAKPDPEDAGWVDYVLRLNALGSAVK